MANRSQKEPILSDGQVRVGTGYAGGSWGGLLDLNRGVVSWTGDKASQGEHPIAAHHLKVLRDNAASAHAAGDFHYREQFANGGAQFDIRLQGTTVVLQHETDGGNYCTRVQPIWDYMCARARMSGDQVRVWQGPEDEGWGLQVDLAAATLTWLGEREPWGVSLLSLKDVNSLHWQARRVVTEGEADKSAKRRPGRDVQMTLTLDGKTHRLWLSPSGGQGWVRTVWEWVQARQDQGEQPQA